MNTFEIVRAIAVIVLGASGTWLLLPHRHGRIKPARSYLAGAILAGIALILLASLWRAPSDFLHGVFFYAFGIAALAGALLSVTSRDPIYSALWFAAVVLATSGLFLLSGAQFLAAGTIIVYAGAIIVTFLFVLMLAQKEGRATYDRAARSPARATATCFLLLWTLIYALISMRAPLSGEGKATADLETRLTRASAILTSKQIVPTNGMASVVIRSLSPTNKLPDAQPDTPALGRHVAGLGGALYTDHLITVELAGSLLFVALIGALMLATPKPPVRPASAGETRNPV